MKKWFSKIRALIARIAPSIFEVSTYCNLTLAFIVLIVEKGGARKEIQQKYGRYGIAVDNRNRCMELQLICLWISAGASACDIGQAWCVCPMTQYHAKKHALQILVDKGLINETAEAAICAQSIKISTVEANLSVQRAHLIQDTQAVLTQQELQKRPEMGNARSEAKVDRHLFRLAEREQGQAD